MPSPPEPSRASRPALIAAFAAVYLIWGSTYLAIRFGLDSIPPLLLAGVRSIIGGGVLYGWGRWRGGPRLSSAEWGTAAMIGGLMFGIGHGSVFWAIQRVPSGVAALFIATTPLWMAVAQSITGGRAAIRPRMVFGLLGGLGGIAMLVGPRGLVSGEPVDPLGAVVLLIAAVAWAAGSAVARRARTSSVLVGTGSSLLAGGLLLLLGALAAGEPARLQTMTIEPRSLLALVYLIAFGSIVALGAYNWLLRHTSLVALSTYAYVNPVVALILGWLIGGEPLGLRVIAAGCLILLSVGIIMGGPRR